MSDRTRVLLSEASVDSFDAYVSQESGRALEKALAMAPEAVIAEIKKSCLRGRGGAGVSTGVKWASVAHDPCPTKYLVCNGAEGEPGSFKDRFLLRSNPYQLLEGMAIAARAIGVRTAYLCLKKSFEKEVAAVRPAMDEMTAAKALGSIPIELVLGPEGLVSLEPGRAPFVACSAAALWIAAEDRIGSRIRRVHCVRRHGLYGARRAQALGIPLRRIVRPVHALQVRHEPVDVLSSQAGAWLRRPSRSGSRARGLRHGAAREPLLFAGRALVADSVDRQELRRRIRATFQPRLSILP